MWVWGVVHGLSLIVGAELIALVYGCEGRCEDIELPSEGGGW